MAGKYYISIEKAAFNQGISIAVLEMSLSKIGIAISPDANGRMTFAQYQSLQKEIGEQRQRQENEKEFDLKYHAGATVESTISQIISPSQIITQIHNEYIGRLSITDISWGFADALDSFSQFRIGQSIKCVIIKVDKERQQILLSQKQLKIPATNNISWGRLDLGDEIRATVIEEFYSCYLLKLSSGGFGTTLKAYGECLFGEEKKFRIQSKLDDCELLRLVPASLELPIESEPRVEFKNEFRFIEADLRDYYSFKKSILGAHSSDYQIEFIQNGFKQLPNLFSKELELPHVLHLNFEDKHPSWEIIFKQNAIPFFFPGAIHNSNTEQRLLDKLNQDSYWVRFNQYEKKNRPGTMVDTFSFFNEDINIYGEVTKSKDNKEILFSIRDFTFGHSSAKASDAKKRNAKYGAFLFRSPLKITPPNSPTIALISQKENLETIRLKVESFKIVQSLKQDAGEILRQEGQTLRIIDKFLEYQERLLTEIDRAQAIFVSEHKPTHSPEGGVALLLPQEVGDSLELDEESLVIVKTKHTSNGSLEKFAEATLSNYNSQCRLVFGKNIRIEQLDQGFYLEKHISKRQIQIQREIIEDFLLKKIKIDHIESLLVYPDKIRTPIESTVELLNPELRATEEQEANNNQIRAVRKAIGNQNIFLIQGPPGTGKTTVISEIIEQLVKKGKKVLVSGQNHVAVDNVLEKVSRAPGLNLLRVGKADRIDTDLAKYHIDSLAQAHEQVYVNFLKNQLALLCLLYECRTNSIKEPSAIHAFNYLVENYSSEYFNLKETLIHKHYVLREEVKLFTENEIAQSIVSLEEWINAAAVNVSSLLKPIIYNSLNVVFATCIGIRTDYVFRNTDFKFDVVIVDEAGKASIAETLVAIELGRDIILVGDQKQLPPYIDSALIDERNPDSFPKSEFGFEFTPEEIRHALTTSFFEFLINRIKAGEFPSANLEMLNYQHRMHPSIGEFVSRSFYDGTVMNGSKTHLNKLQFPPPFDKEIIFFDTSTSPEPYEQSDGYSAKNNTEAESISEVILPKLFENLVSPQEIAIIAPYKSQVTNIQRYIANSQLCQHKNIDVSTLDSFQGKEYDIIIFSFTRSADHKRPPIINGRKKYIKVGFLDDARRLNVAFSRARKKLILIGNSISLTDPRSHNDLLFNYTELFRNLISLSKNEAIGCFTSIANYHDFRSPFEKFTANHQVGDELLAKIESVGRSGNHAYGFFLSCDGFIGLLPFSLILTDEGKAVVNKSLLGDSLQVSVADIDKEKLRVTFRLCETDSFNSFIKRFQVGQTIRGKVHSIATGKNGVFGLNLEVKSQKCLLHINEMTGRTRSQLNNLIGQFIIVNVKSIDHVRRRIDLSELSVDRWQVYRDRLLPGNTLRGYVFKKMGSGYMVELEIGLKARLLKRNISRGKTIELNSHQTFIIDSVNFQLKYIDLSY